MSSVVASISVPPARATRAVIAALYMNNNNNQSATKCHADGQWSELKGEAAANEVVLVPDMQTSPLCNLYTITASESVIPAQRVSQ